MGKRFCIVCGYQCRDLVKPFGILTPAVPAHHYHADKSIRDAWLKRQELLRFDSGQELHR